MRRQIEWKQNPANGHWYGATYAASTWTAGEAFAVSLGGHLGMPGCYLRVDPETLWPFIHAGGEVTWSYPVPWSPMLLGGHFYVQMLLFDPFVPNPANTFGAVTSDGLAGVVGY